MVVLSVCFLVVVRGARGPNEVGRGVMLVLPCGVFCFVCTFCVYTLFCCRVYTLAKKKDKKGEKKAEKKGKRYQ